MRIVKTFKNSKYNDCNEVEVVYNSRWETITVYHRGRKITFDMTQVKRIKRALLNHSKLLGNNLRKEFIRVDIPSDVYYREDIVLQFYSEYIGGWQSREKNYFVISRNVIGRNEVKKRFEYYNLDDVDINCCHIHEFIDILDEIIKEVEEWK